MIFHLNIFSENYYFLVNNKKKNPFIMLPAAGVIDTLTLCMLSNFVFFSRLWIIFFKLTFSKKFLSGIPSECQTVWIQIRSDNLSGLIWVQTVCKGYQQMTKVVTSGERVNG